MRPRLTGDGRNGAERPIVVLKFGSSILDGIDGYREAALEVAREVARGRRVVAVVSAMAGVTDGLSSLAEQLSTEPSPELVARLLATGEAASVSLLAMAVESLGIGVHDLVAEEARIRTTGPPLDADPEGVDADLVASLLQLRPVLVVPGFVGVGPEGAVTLLGRGGSDLTALFLAERLGAAECRLVKDVDGVYPTDPNAPGGPTWAFTFASWDRVLDVAGELVQAKAVHFARERGLRFRVAALAGRGTWVGAAEEALV